MVSRAVRQGGAIPNDGLLLLNLKVTTFLLSEISFFLYYL